MEIKRIPKTDDTRWGVYHIECVFCGAKRTVVAPIYAEFDCHHCGSKSLEFDTTDNRFCSPPSEVAISNS